MAEFRCAADIAALPLARLEEALRALEAAGIDELYCCVRDGVFEGPHGGGIEVVRAGRACCGLPVHVHLAAVRPERWVDAYVEAGARSVTVHAEACPHGHRVLAQIRDAGAEPGIALCPATPLTRLDYLLPLAARVLVRTGLPESADPGLIGKACDRVRILRDNIAYHEYRCEIDVEGGIDAPAAGRYVRFGARRLVLGSPTLADKAEGSYAAELKVFRAAIADAGHLV